MRTYTVTCKPCGRVLARAVPRITEHEMATLRVHVQMECASRMPVPGVAVGDVLARVAVEDA